MTVTMNGSVANHLLLTRYVQLPNELYIEQKNEEIVRTFFSAANKEGKQAEAKSQQQKKATGEERSEIEGHSGYVAKSQTK